MSINKVKMVNFKCYKGEFEVTLNSGLNVIVGDNESGKSTILEAIHLALTGIFNGKYLKNELTQYLFNSEIVKEYLNAINKEEHADLPYVLIEIYFSDGFPKYQGTYNLEKEDTSGITLKIEFDESYKNEYQEAVKKGNIKSLPIEYYMINWTSFARDKITVRNIPVKSAMIDSSSFRYHNGSDMYISRIVKNNLTPEDIVDVSQAHRHIRDVFMDEPSIIKINEKIKNQSTISNKKVELSVEMLSKNAWENSLVTYLDEIPFHYNGKGEQCIIKTDLALSQKSTITSSVVLLEEPENHLSFSRLNMLINRIKKENNERQMIISTHSSFVANKLGLEKLFLLNDGKILPFKELDEQTYKFFMKIAGYDTLRLILCKKAILVEGDSDELVVQKAYISLNDGKLPIEDGIDVISVGIAFLRFLKIAEVLNKEVIVITDNDGNTDALERKYSEYLGNNKKEKIVISYDNAIDTGELKIGNKPFNYNTLEPKILKANNYDIELFNTIFNTSYTELDGLHKYMKNNKTDCALKIFEFEKVINFPEYILEGVR